METKNNQKPVKVSVIVVNFNGMPYIETCISSLLKQSYQDFEIILVDNGSTDGSLEYAKNRFPELVIVANKSNLGYLGGIISGIDIAKGEYISPINYDTEVASNWLTPMVEFLMDNPKVGAVTPKILLYQARDRINALGLKVHITGLGWVRGLYDREDKFPDQPVRVASVSGCSYVVRRDVFQQIEGLIDHQFMYYDDVELSWLINLLGYEIYCVPKSVMYHRYELKMNPEKFQWLEYNRLSLLIRCLSRSSFIIILPFLGLTELMIAGYCLIRGKKYISSKFRSATMIIKSFKQLMEKRQGIQRLRKISDLRFFRILQFNYEWKQLLGITKE